MLPRALWYHRKAMKQFRYPRAELNFLKDRKVRRMVRLAYERVPHYHDTMKRAGLHPDDVASAADLRRLPVLTKTTLRAGYPGRMRAGGSHVAVTQHSSGTTGTPVYVDWSPHQVDVHVALRLRRNGEVGLRPLDRLATISFWGSNASDSTPRHGRPSRLGKALRFAFGTEDVRHPLLRQKAFGLTGTNLASVSGAVGAFRPKAIFSRPTYLRRIARMLAESQKPIAVPRLLCEGEVLTSGVKRDLEKAFSGEALAWYGANEFGGLGFECLSHSGIHLEDDAYAFEVLGNDGEVIDGEGRGQLVITALENDAMPLIRYSIGDSVAASPSERCGCGSYFRRLSALEGRVSDGLVGQSNLRLPPGPTLEYAENVLGLRDYQLVQRSAASFLLKVKEGNDDPFVAEGMRRHLAAQLGSEPSLETMVWSEDDIPPKYRPLVSEVGLQTQS